jgi:putative Ca2+/H+ antiporter (TMEM165/GDT1 family)
MIDLKMFGLVFATVFLAKLGDKIQSAALLFSSKESSKLFVVFAAASQTIDQTARVAAERG